MTARTDPFDILGVLRNATPEQIREAYFRRVREHPPEDDPEGFQAVSEAYRVLSDPDEVRRRAAEIHLTDREAESLRRKLDLASRSGQSSDEVLRAVGADPGASRDLRMHAAILLLEKEKAALALPILDALHRADPSDLRSTSLRGRALAELGRYDEADVVFATLIRTNPRDEQAWHARIWCAWQRGNHRGAAARCDAAAAAWGSGAPASIQFHLRRLHIAIELRDEEMTRAAAGAACASIPGDDREARAHFFAKFAWCADRALALRFSAGERIALEAALRQSRQPELEARLRRSKIRASAVAAAASDESVPRWIREMLRLHEAAERGAAGPQSAKRLAELFAEAPERRRKEWVSFQRTHPDAASVVAFTFAAISRGAARTVSRRKKIAAVIALPLVAGVVVVWALANRRERSAAPHPPTLQEILRSTDVLLDEVRIHRMWQEAKVAAWREDRKRQGLPELPLPTRAELDAWAKATGWRPPGSELFPSPPPPPRRSSK